MAKNNTEVRYIFITDTLKDTVTDSAIINWLQLFEKKGMSFDIIITPKLGFFLRTRSSIELKIKDCQNKISGQVYKIPLISGAKQLLLFCALVYLFFNDMLHRRQIVIQTRVPHLTALKLLRRLYSRIFIVYDVRGAAAEEFLMSLKNRPVKSRLRKLLFRSQAVQMFAYKTKLSNMLNFALMADTVMCVSNKLREYLLHKCSKLDSEKIRIIPGSAEQSKFFWDQEARAVLRQKLKINDKFVLVYAGALSTAWQMPDFIFDVFARLARRAPNVFLLCLTPHKEIVQSYMRKHALGDNQVWADYIKYEEINNYLCASDAGILFRENSATNNVASPTKFAEYILTGLPVIISEGIGDFSGFVSEHRAGLVVDNQSDNLISDIENTILKMNFDRKKIAALGSAYFTKDKNLDIFLDIYSRASRVK